MLPFSNFTRRLSYKRRRAVSLHLRTSKDNKNSQIIGSAEVDLLQASSFNCDDFAFKSCKTLYRSKSSPTILNLFWTASSSSTTTTRLLVVEDKKEKSVIDRNVVLFPLPEEVVHDHPIFKLVQADVHLPYLVLPSETNDNNFIPHETTEGGGQVADCTINNNTHLVTESPEQTCPRLTDEHCSQVIHHDDDTPPLLSVQFEKSKYANVVGNFDDQEFVMKHTNSGKVWLWDRPDDLLVIKEDGRLIDPTIKSDPKQSKSYKVKSSVGKLYDHFFSSKKCSTRAKNVWRTTGTSSLDRRDIFKVAKNSVPTSQSTFDVFHPYENP